MPECVLVLLILGLGAAWAIEIGRSVRQRARCETFIADMKAFAAAFESARGRSTGASTPDSAGDMPAALRGTAAATRWAAGSPFGGRYEWLEPAAGSGRAQGAIAVTAFAPGFPLEVSRDDLVHIDRKIDDGDLTTGRFRTGFNGWPTYRLGPKG